MANVCVRVCARLWCSVVWCGVVCNTALGACIWGDSVVCSALLVSVVVLCQ